MLLYKQYIKLPLKVQWPWPGSFPTLHVCKATMDYRGSTPIYPSWGSGCLCWTMLSPSGTQQGLSQPPVLLSSLPSMHAPGTVLMASVRVGGCLQPTTQGQVPLGLLVALACAGCPGQWEAGEVSGWGVLWEAAALLGRWFIKSMFLGGLHFGAFSLLPVRSCWPGHLAVSWKEAG